VVRTIAAGKKREDRSDAPREMEDRSDVPGEKMTGRGSAKRIVEGKESAIGTEMVADAIETHLLALRRPVWMNPITPLAHHIK
jgi:hypothetical protein